MRGDISNITRWIIAVTGEFKAAMFGFVPHYCVILRIRNRVWLSAPARRLALTFVLWKQCQGENKLVFIFRVLKCVRLFVLLRGFFTHFYF